MIVRDMSMEFTDALLVTLRSCFESLSSEDVQAIRDLHATTQSTQLATNSAEGSEVPPAPDKQESCCWDETAGGKHIGRIVMILAISMMDRILCPEELGGKTNEHALGVSQVK